MHCYRHPDREAYVRCQRCERFICPECQYEAAVGFLCPEDAGQNNLGARVKNAAPRGLRNQLNSGKPIVTRAIILVCFAMYALQLVFGESFTRAFEYSPLLTLSEPWRMITSAFIHDPYDFLHIGFNMYTLWIFGRELETMLGKGRYLALYLISALGGSVAILWISDPTTFTLGASGAIFGLMGAYFVVMRSLGANSNSMLVLVAINLAWGFLVPGISWEAHLGGLVTGMLVTAAYAKTRNDASPRNRKLLVLAILALLLVLSIVGGGKVLAGF